MPSSARREFLKTLAGAGPLPWPRPPSPARPRSPTTASAWAWSAWAAGCTRTSAAWRRSPTESDNVEIAAICDCDQSKLDAADQELPGTGRAEIENLHRPAETV